MTRKYRIYQVADKDLVFCSMDILKAVGINVDSKNYQEVYAGEIDTPYKTPELILEELYAKFNMNRPADFTGHSMSVSDVIALDSEYYFCDSFDWVRLQKFM